MENRINESPWNKENLEIILDEIKFDFKPYHMEFTDIVPEKIIEETDPLPELPKEPKSKLGDIYCLGYHRVMCGDCTKNLDELIMGDKIDLLLTDPPYGVDYAEKNKYLNSIAFANRIETPIKNDNITDYRKFYKSFLELIPFSDYNSLYVFLRGRHTNDLTLAIEDLGFYWSTWLVWLKNNHVLGRMDYNTKHELILYGWKGKHKFYGGFQTSVLEANKPNSSSLHPTMKPVELLTKLLLNSTKKDMIVYDPFLGSGSTLIACEQTNRICYGMEIDPAYVDVIVKRWENFTGKKAKLLP